MTQTNNIRKPRRQLRLSMKWKVFGFLALFTAIILIILWLTQTVFLADIYKMIKMRDIKAGANTITDSISSEELQNTVDDIARKNGFCIIVQDAAGKTIADSDGLHSCVIHNISSRDLSRLFIDAKKTKGYLLERFKLDPHTGTFHSVKEQETTSEENIILTLCYNDKDGNEGVIFINALLTPVGATVKTLNTMLTVISFALLAIALLLSLVISYSITNPIKKLTKSANELAKGNYDTVFPSKSSKEISALADTLNYAAAELKKNEALKRELIANISHDLRTPLTLITGYGEVMRDIPNEMTADNLQIIIDESKRLSSLVTDILDISKLQANTIELKPEYFDINEVIKETFTRYQKLVDQEGYDISLFLSAPCYVYADRQRILQVLYNFVNNAVTHTGKDKKVMIAQSVVDHMGTKYVRIEINDTGDGIAPEELPLIWDRYYKVDKFHKRAQMGSGLGLSIVKSIIELHNGYYGVSSTLGVGSSFWFELRTFNDSTKESN